MNAQVKDPLEGFRGNVTQFARSIVKESDKPDAALWDRMYLGGAALRLMQGIANTEDTNAVIGRMIAQCEMDIQQSCTTFINETDPNSPSARRAHFEARVSAAIIGRMNQFVADALQAEHEHNNPEEPAQ